MHIKLSSDIRCLFPPSLLVFGAVIAAMLCTGAQAASTNPEEVEHTLPNNPEINIWVDRAPLELMVGQLAQESGRQINVKGELKGQVSGRFTGSVSDTLAALSSTHSILFNLTDDTLQAISKDAQSSVSIALSGPQLDEQFVASLSSESLLGNTVEFRDDSVRISGHPEFVTKVTQLITSAIAENIGTKRVNSGGSAELSVQNLNSSLAAMDTTIQPVVDAGAQVMLEDILDESLPETERAALSKPIRWITDVPGYTTF